MRYTGSSKLKEAARALQRAAAALLDFEATEPSERSESTGKSDASREIACAEQLIAEARMTSSSSVIGSRAIVARLRQDGHHDAAEEIERLRAALKPFARMTVENDPDFARHFPELSRRVKVAKRALDYRR